jgi:signal transduction histidine kinase
MASEPTPLARYQSRLFVDVFRRQTEGELRVIRRTARISELRQLADRILGPTEAIHLFPPGIAREQGAIASDDLISRVEQRLGANVGAATARSLVSSVVTSESISVEELKRLADETEQVRAYSAELERNSRQLEAAAAKLTQANAQLREIDLQKDEFLSHVSHEVRTPMTSIRSFSDILLTNPDIDPAQMNRYLRIIQNESLRLTRLLDGILDINRMENGGTDWAMKPIDPEISVDSAMASCASLAQTAGVTLKRRGRARRTLVTGNEDRLAQVLINLISNAIKYNTSREPAVVVSSSVRKGVYEIRVTDNGPGIPPGERERIFAKFARGPMPRQQGVGLGLAISRQIVKKLGGTLSLATPRNGAEFVLSLPVARAATVAEGSGSADEAT